MTQQKEATKNRNYKDTMFKMIFQDKKSLLELYNAISGRNYTDPELLTVNTLENAIYLNFRNDISFIIDSTVSLYEHQSTYNPNMPLRFLIYLGELYAGMVTEENMYSSRTVKIPAPRFVVFYNGTSQQPEHQVHCMSDAYITKEDECNLELKVDMFNINKGYNEHLQSACKALRDYSEYVSRVRHYASNMDISDAVDRTIEECIEEGILREFLQKQKAEAKAMSIFEYDQEKHIELERKEWFEYGKETERVNTEAERQRADAEKERADAEKERADAEKQRADQLELELLQLREKIFQEENNLVVEK